MLERSFRFRCGSPNLKKGLGLLVDICNDQFWSKEALQTQGQDSNRLGGMAFPWKGSIYSSVSLHLL
jgi:hypothetical protein